MFFRKVLVKVIVLGDSGVGKSSLIKRYMGKQFDYEYITTIGVDKFVKEYELYLGGKIIKIMWNIWDFSGQPRWKSLMKVLYRGAIGSVLVYDVSDVVSYDNTVNWLREMMSVVGKRPLILVGNKIDLRRVLPDCLTKEDGLRKAQELSRILGMRVPYIEVSAKEEINVDLVFLELGKIIVRYIVERILQKRSALLETGSI
ncbi:MAG: hypothetical protein DRP08_08095 [Candidatus Aenigmatarchaeota archaeon]|nr:MAG: hypothetical protein DRP08_08095 [Candidatus Aenigmarchaeota archaeon]